MKGQCIVVRAHGSIGCVGQVGYRSHQVQAKARMGAICKVPEMRGATVAKACCVHGCRSVWDMEAQGQGYGIAGMQK